MPQLKYYKKERDKFDEAYNTYVSDKEALQIARKLQRHFRCKHYGQYKSIYFRGKRQSGVSKTWCIGLSHNPSIGLICHEVAHETHRRHNKKLMQLVRKMTKYCKKKNYWKTSVI